jgi:amidohydrolase
MTDLFSESMALFESTRALRRDFHRNPELGFQEVRTSGIVAKTLMDLGLEVTTGIGKTGVVAILEGQSPGPVVLLRFDMDALPILEETGAEYASQNAGVMHACGHDGHTAVGLTVARLLHAHSRDLAGSVKIVFQPAEEGLGGAQAMIADGVLEGPRPDYALSLHLWNEKPLGWLGIRSGPLMAAGEIFKVSLTGKGGHGALPHRAIDPVLAAAHVVTALQGIVSRNVSPLESAAVSVTTIRGGEAFNVIPQTVEMLGTIRTFLPEVRQQVLDRFSQIVEGVAGAMGCQASVEVNALTPAVINEAGITQRVQEAARLLWPDQPVDSSYQTMVSEDMAYMMQQVPGCYFLIGSANPAKGLDAPHHHPRFDIDEDALPRAAALMAASTMHLLGSTSLSN